MNQVHERISLERNLSLVLGRQVRLGSPDLQGLDPRALKKAFYRRAHEYHPDKAAVLGKDPEYLANRFRSLQDAYELVLDSWNSGAYHHLEARAAEAPRAYSARCESPVRGEGAARRDNSTRSESSGRGGNSARSDNSTRNNSAGPAWREAQAAGSDERAQSRRRPRTDSSTDSRADPRTDSRADSRTDSRTDPRTDSRAAEEDRPRENADAQTRRQARNRSHAHADRRDSAETRDTRKSRSENTDGGADCARSRIETAGAGVFHSGPLPRTELRLAQYLYYLGKIDWNTLIRALCWQYRSRPRTGDIAVELGYMTRHAVHKTLTQRKAGELFGQAALRMGSIEPGEFSVVMGRQRLMKLPIGRYFIDRGLLTEEEMDSCAEDLRRHNITVRSEAFTAKL